MTELRTFDARSIIPDAPAGFVEIMLSIEQDNPLDY